jgi:hypothetical protein
LQITRILKSHHLTKNTFVNTYAANTLPYEPGSYRPSAYVVNLSPLQTVGSHWICMYFPVIGDPEYFDTFASEIPAHFRQFMGPFIIKNNVSVQHPFSTACGQHVIFYIWQRCRNKSITQIMDLYSNSNLLLNDVMVTLIVNKNFGLNLQIIDDEFINTLD